MTLLRHAVGPSHLPWVVRGDYRPTCDQRTLSTHATDPLEIEADTGPAEERLNACQRDDHYLAVLRATLAPRRSCAHTFVRGWSTGSILRRDKHVQV